MGCHRCYGPKQDTDLKRGYAFAAMYNLEEAKVELPSDEVQRRFMILFREELDKKLDEILD